MGRLDGRLDPARHDRAVGTLVELDDDLEATSPDGPLRAGCDIGDARCDEGKAEHLTVLYVIARSAHVSFVRPAPPAVDGYRPQSAHDVAARVTHCRKAVALDRSKRNLVVALARQPRSRAPG